MAALRRPARRVAPQRGQLGSLTPWAAEREAKKPDNQKLTDPLAKVENRRKPATLERQRYSQPRSSAMRTASTRLRVPVLAIAADR